MTFPPWKPEEWQHGVSYGSEGARAYGRGSKEGRQILLTNLVRILPGFSQIVDASWKKAATLSETIDIRKDCYQNKSKLITEDQFTKHMSITIH